MLYRSCLAKPVPCQYEKTNTVHCCAHRSEHRDERLMYCIKVTLSRVTVIHPAHFAHSRISIRPVATQGHVIRALHPTWLVNPSPSEQPARTRGVDRGQVSIALLGPATGVAVTTPSMLMWAYWSLCSEWCLPARPACLPACSAGWLPPPHRASFTCQSPLTASSRAAPVLRWSANGGGGLLRLGLSLLISERTHRRAGLLGAGCAGCAAAVGVCVSGEPPASSFTGRCQLALLSLTRTDGRERVRSPTAFLDAISDKCR